MNVFIDTNIYLKFYHYSNAELEELEKLIVLIQEGELKLFITRQVLNEYTRNRETKIADALRTFKEDKLTSSFPAFFKEYDEFENMRKALNEYHKNKKNLLDKIVIEIDNHTLKADSIMNQLIVTAGVIEQNDEIIKDAKQRFDLGNPPGKKNSYGDALNWITLMRNIYTGEDIHFISDDKDYFSEIDNTKFNNYLLKEWRTLKASNLYFFKSLPDFFKHHYPQIKLASDIQKDIYIERLKASGSFRDSRYYLQRLSSFDDFTSDQINRIIEASLDNYQIYWISEDFDINVILYNFVDKYGNSIEEAIKQRFLSSVKRIQHIESV